MAGNNDMYMLRICVFLILCLVSVQGFSQQKVIQGQDLEKLDSELAGRTAQSESIFWVDSKQLTIEGMGWNKGIEGFTRLPDNFKHVVTAKVWALSRHSAGLAIRFMVKGTKSISARWTLRGNGYMAHMTPQAVNGLDLYVKTADKWVWAGVGKPSKDGLTQENTLKSGFLPDRTYECMVYLPLYSGITALDLGFSPGASVVAAQINPKKPLVFYGTSILHGCSASRSGMPFAAMLGRKFDRPVINLGFSGNGLMEPYFADILAEIDAAVYFIDCLPNMGAFTEAEIKERTIHIVRKLRSKRPDVPIVLVEDRSYAYANLGGQPAINYRRMGMQSAYRLLKADVKNLHYVNGDGLLGEDTEATVDGSHPSDLGMYRYFMYLSPLVSKILN